MSDILSTETIEELETIISTAYINDKIVDLHTLYSGLSCIAQKYSLKIYEELKKKNIPVDEIEGTGQGPGLGHVIWATALITIAWTSFLFPDKGLNRFNREISEGYKMLVNKSIDDAINIGNSYVGMRGKKV